MLAEFIANNPVNLKFKFQTQTLILQTQNHSTHEKRSPSAFVAAQLVVRHPFVPFRFLPPFLT